MIRELRYRPRPARSPSKSLGSGRTSTRAGLFRSEARRHAAKFGQVRQPRFIRLCQTLTIRRTSPRIGRHCLGLEPCLCRSRPRSKPPRFGFHSPYCWCSAFGNCFSDCRASIREQHMFPRGRIFGSVDAYVWTRDTAMGAQRMAGTSISGTCRMSSRR